MATCYFCEEEFPEEELEDVLGYRVCEDCREDEIELLTEG